MVDDTLPVAFRPAIHSDYGFILKSWNKEFHTISPNNFIPNSIYVPEQTKIINNIVHEIVPLICHIDDDPDNLVGYLVAEKMDDKNIVIHWGYIKSIYRRLGIMQEMLKTFDPHYKSKTLQCTHFFKMFKQLQENYNLLYNPLLKRSYEK